MIKAEPNRLGATNATSRTSVVDFALTLPCLIASRIAGVLTEKRAITFVLGMSSI